MTRGKSNLLCVEIVGETVAAALFASAATQPRPLAAAMVARDGRPLGQCLAELRRRLGEAPGERCLVALGAEHFSFRTVSLPFAEPRKVAMVLPMELAEQMPQPIDELLVESTPVGAADNSGVTVLAALLPRLLLTEIYAALAEVGWRPSSVTLAGFDLARSLLARGEEEFLLLDGEAGRFNLLLAHGGRVAGIRPLFSGAELAAGAEVELLDEIRRTVLADPRGGLALSGASLFHNGPCPVAVSAGPWHPRPCPIAAAPGEILGELGERRLRRLFAMATRPAREGQRLEFCRGEFAPRPALLRAAGQRGRAALAVALGLLVACGLFGYDYARLVAQRDDLQRRLAAAFAETAPAGSRMVDPVRQLQVMIRELEGAGARNGATGRATVVEVLAEISLRIPAQLPVRVARFAAEGEMYVLKGSTADYNTVEAVRAALERSPLFSAVSIAAATQQERGQRVGFELKLLPAR